MSTRVEYPISAGYCENWGMDEILRELIANALDSRAPVEITHDPVANEAVIRDYGKGFKAHCLMLGEGEKKDGQQIGQFREGLKIALLAAARAKIPVRLRTTGCSVESASMETLALGRKGLVLRLNGDRLDHGTEIRIQCSQWQVDEARKLFLRFTVGTDVPVIFTLPDAQRQKVYVNGLQTVVGGWAFSYNLRGDAVKSAMNRDRTALKHAELRDAIGRIWQKCKSPELIQQFLSKVDNEHGEWQIQLPVKKTWRRALLINCGLSPRLKKVAYPGSTEHNSRLKQLGWHILDCANRPIVRHLAWNMFPDARSALDNAMQTAETKNADAPHEGQYRKVSWDSLDEGLIREYEDAVSRVLTALWPHLGPDTLHAKLFHAVDHFRWFVFSKSSLDGDRSVGCWLSGRHAIGIRRSMLGASDKILEGIVVHELAHFLSGATDATVEFEQMLTYILNRLLQQPESYPPMTIKVDVRTRKVLRIPDWRPAIAWAVVRDNLRAHGLSVVDLDHVLDRTSETCYLGYEGHRTKRLLFIDPTGVERAVITVKHEMRVAKVKVYTEPVMTGSPFFWAKDDASPFSDLGRR